MKLAQLLERRSSKVIALPLQELAHYKLDKRFSPMVQSMHDDSVKTIQAFLGSTKPELSFKDDNYTIHVMPTRYDHRYVIEKQGVKLPVPAGKWMGFWDPNLKPYCTPEEYKQADEKQRMKWDCMVQADKYVDDQFFNNYAHFWCPSEYEKWWWSDDPRLEASRYSTYQKTNAYWKKRLDL